MADEKKSSAKSGTQKDSTGGTEAPAQGAGQVKIRWDQTNVRSSYANVINAQGTREEIVLFFGMNQSWDANQREITVHVSDRIVLSPFTAKRLSMILNNALQEYEKKYGVLDVESRRPLDAPVQ